MSLSSAGDTCILGQARDSRSFRRRIASGVDMQALADWDSFYVIVGSSAGALIGLQFVVMTLVAANPPKGVTEGSAAFSTPTVVHFSVVLLLAALLRIPWQTVGSAAVAWGVLGLCGAIYALAIARRMRTQSVYT